jgi:hypothetical protein
MVAQADLVGDLVGLLEAEHRVLVPQGKDMLVVLGMQLPTNRAEVEAVQVGMGPMVLPGGHMDKAEQAVLGH